MKIFAFAIFALFGCAESPEFWTSADFDCQRICDLESQCSAMPEAEYPTSYAQCVDLCESYAAESAPEMLYDLWHNCVEGTEIATVEDCEEYNGCLNDGSL